MAYVTVLFASIILIFAQSGHSYVRVSNEIMAAFNHFVIQFNKTYGNENKKDKAIVNFGIEYTSIKSHNFGYLNGSFGFGRRINQFSDLTLRDKQKVLNGLKIQNSPSNQFSIPSSSSSLPSSRVSSSFNFNDYGFGSNAISKI